MLSAAEQKWAKQRAAYASQWWVVFAVFGLLSAFVPALLLIDRGGSVYFPMIVGLVVYVVGAMHYQTGILCRWLCTLEREIQELRAAQNAGVSVADPLVPPDRTNQSSITERPG